MKLKYIHTLLIAVALLSTFYNQSTFAEPSLVVGKKSAATKRGDKAFNRFDFANAVKIYSYALKRGKGDTTYIVQQIADAYRLLNDQTNAAQWYGRLAANSNSNPTNKFYYAEALRATQKYDLAKRYYQEYKALVPSDKNVDDIIASLDNVQDLSKDKGLYHIETLSINSHQSDFGPSFYKDGKIFFTSNRNARLNSGLQDNWSKNNFYQVYLGTPDGGNNNAVTKVKTIHGCKPNGRFHDGPTAYYAPNQELIFTRSNYKQTRAKTAKDRRTVKLELYSMKYPAKKKKFTPLPINDNEFSNSHPSISKDGNTLFFASDRPGGQGGVDLYYSTRTANGPWGEPKNLGKEINSRFDEKFPFIANDGTLYFSSNAYGGLGGLDVYKTKLENGKWTKPENLGAPINSNADDFTFVIDSANKHGYFASNRSTGMGDDDIYGFTYDAPKNYKVTVRVVDANTQNPIGNAGLALDCNPGTENTNADASGEHIFIIKSGKPCSVEASNNGYKNNTGQISSRNKNSVVVIPLTPDKLKLVVSVKEKETMQPLQDVAISIIPKGNPMMNYRTDSTGKFETPVTSGVYDITSADYPGLQSSFTQADADASGTIYREFLIPFRDMVVNVPLTANCFTSTVSVTDLKTGVREEVAPNANGETLLDLKLNSRFAIEHNGTVDTISTMGLKPGQIIDGPCKFYVGQTWVIRNIYYDLDKSYIRPDAAVQLDNIVHIMKDNPTLEIELSSHTDCRQTALYNMNLSARRAKAAVDYIAKHGVKAKRLLAAGYGETRLTNNCACEPTNDSNCTEAQHQANRRTEAKVLKY